MRNVILFFASLLFFSCTKNKTEIVDTPTPIIETYDVKKDDTINFIKNQNINFRNELANPDGQVNIWCDCTNAKIGTINNVYLFCSKNTKVGVFSTCMGQVYQLNQVENSGHAEWYFKIEYMGNFNGNTIFNITTYPY